ncbi:MAG TPA: DUF3089 domain-containing protein [Candidatus Binatia bacterium]|jgi:hypothetical protein|nr:DUF3089 domain-containing protein [Candidatus Binatia bacterium]
MHIDTFHRRTAALLTVVLFSLASRVLAADALLAGSRLTLTTDRVRITSTDPAIGLGGGAGSADDPTLHGGSLRVLSIAGDVFDSTYELPASGWRAVRRRGLVIGWTYRSTGSIRSVRVRAGNTIRVRGRGGLGHTLGTNPDPVRVILTLGAQQQCLRFGGTPSFTTNRSYHATDSTAPDVCPLPLDRDDRWLCRPGITPNHCLDHDLTATVVHPDLSTTVEPHAGAEDQPFDCFYVYPTVDLSAAVGNHENVTDPAYVALTLDPLLSQAARFNGTCRLFAPHYRQTTFATLQSPNAAFYQDLAYRDVLDAWRLYLKQYNGGRNVVIMGHSQGVFMLTRLLQEEIDPSPALRSKLIVALLVGGNVGVPQGEIVGGSFQHLPLCTSVDETGCVIAYHSFAADMPPVGTANAFFVDPALDVACTNPAALGGGSADGAFAGSYFGLHPSQPLFDVVADGGATTPFLLYENFYSGRCVKDATNHSYLAIDATPAPGDLRTDPVLYASPALSPALLGLHVLDYSWPMRELLDLVAAKAAAMP